MTPNLCPNGQRKTHLMQLIELKYGEPIETLYGRWLRETGMTIEKISYRLNRDGIETTYSSVHHQIKRLGGREKLVADVEATATG